MPAICEQTDLNRIPPEPERLEEVLRLLGGERDPRGLRGHTAWAAGAALDRGDVSHDLRHGLIVPQPVQNAAVAQSRARTARPHFALTMRGWGSSVNGHTAKRRITQRLCRNPRDR